MKKYLDPNGFSYITSNISEIVSTLILSPIKYFFEVKRTWAQFNLKVNFTKFLKIKKSAFYSLTMRDIIFFTSFNNLYYKGVKEANNDPSRLFMNIAISVFISNFISQPFDFVFVRISLDQFENYHNIKQTLQQVKFEDAFKNRWLGGMQYRFLYNFAYYTSLVYMRESFKAQGRR